MVSIKFRILSVALLASSVFFVSPTEALAAIQSLNGQAGQTQTFQDDSNVTISSSNNVHTLGWFGLLPISRGGTGNDTFTEGSLIFMGQNKFRQDNNHLFWDKTNNRLGIGTSSPASTLDVSGNASISGDLDVSGNITSTNLVPYTGATQDVDLGPHNLILGNEGESYFISAADAITNNTDGGELIIYSGLGLGSGSGGTIHINSNDAQDTGNGGNIFMDTGSGGTTSGNGGNFLFIAGKARGGDGNGGDFIFELGERNGSGNFGRFIVENLNGGRAYLDFSELSGERTFTFPSTTGTFGLLESDQTWTGINRFEGSNSTVYVGSTTTPGCIVMGDTGGGAVTYVTANAGVLTASTTKPNNCQ